MKRITALALFLHALVSGVAFAAADCCSVATAPRAETKPAASESEAPVGHPLRGVVLAVMPEKSALLVKHEEIPGVMRAMTMLLKVDASTLAAAKKDRAITATLVKKADGWWLENVRPADEAKPAS
jgi:Copper binding periplasmic protein CusF.